MGAWRSQSSWSGRTQLGSHGILAPAPMTGTWPRGLEGKPPRHGHVPACTPTQTPPRDGRTEPTTRLALLPSSVLQPVTLTRLLMKHENRADGWMGTQRDATPELLGPQDPVPLALTLPLRGGCGGAVHGPVLCLLQISQCSCLWGRVWSLVSRSRGFGLSGGHADLTAQTAAPSPTQGAAGPAVPEGPRPHREQGAATEVGRCSCLVSNPSPRPQLA